MSYGDMKTDRLPEKLARLVSNQSELARKTGIPQSAISSMVSGKRRPYFDQMAAIARELRVPLEYLADDDLDMPPVAEITADERAIVQLIRDMGLDRPTAVKRLTAATVVSSPVPGYEEMEAAKDATRKGRQGRAGA